MRPTSRIFLGKMHSALDPVILSRLLAAHGVLQAGVTVEELPPLVTATLLEVPGVTAVTLSLNGSGSSDEGKGRVRLPVETPAGHYGTLVIDVGDAEAWSGYEASVGDFAGWLALLLEGRRSLVVGLQEALLEVPDRISGVCLGHIYRSAGDEACMGGDFYDVFETRDGSVGIVIGDVSLHGIEAVRMATLVKHSVGAFAHQFASPHHVLRETNRLLLEKKFDGFVTVFVGCFDPTSGTMIYSSAGHPPPLFTENGEVTTIATKSTPLGIFFDARYSDGTITMRPGETMVLYTNGITEARGGDKMFGEEGLIEALRAVLARPADELPALLLEQALVFAGGNLRDDAALLTLRYLGPSSAVR